MKLSTGKVAFSVEFDNGDKAEIYLNPHDKGIQERIRAFEASVDARMKAIDLEKYKKNFEAQLPDIDITDPDKLLELSADELNALQNRFDAVCAIEAEYNDAIKAELDAVFNSNISDVAFRYCEPFDMVDYVDENGKERKEIYIMQFLRCMMVEMKKYGVENQEAMGKHLAKYSK